MRLQNTSGADSPCAFCPLQGKGAGRARLASQTLAVMAALALYQTWDCQSASGQSLNRQVASKLDNHTDQKKLPAPLAALMTATTFDDSVSGESGPRDNYKNYAAATDQIQSLETKDLETLLTRGSPAGRLYGAVLLKQSGRVGNDDSFGKLLNDDAEVTYLSGCKGAGYKVKEIAAAFIKVGSFHNFKFGQYCKLKAPLR